MEKFIPYEKLSKKEKRKMDLAKRQTWGELNPVTRKPRTARPTTETKPGIGGVRFHESQFRVLLCRYSLRAILKSLGGQRYLTVRLYLSSPQL